MSTLLRSAAIGLCAALLLAAPGAAANPLDDAKAAGYVGERPDGMLGLVSSSAPADVVALVEEINAKRVESYAEIAEKNGIPVGAVAAQAGAKLIDRAPAGQYVMRDGKWVRK